MLQANKLILGNLPSLPGSNVKSGDLPNGPQPFTEKFSSGGSGDKVLMFYIVHRPAPKAASSMALTSFNLCSWLIIQCEVLPH